MSEQFDAESALVGCLLLEPDKCADEIFTQLEDKAFANQYAKECFKACEAAYYENSGKFDSATIITKLVSAETKTYAMQCAETVPSLSNWKLYADSVRDAYIRREVIDRANGLVNEYMQGNVQDISEMQSLAEKIAEPFNGVKSALSADSAQAYDIFLQEQAKPRQYMKLGFPSLDACSYIEPGDLVVIGGRPSAGKTAVSLNMLVTLSKNYRCVFFSCETRREKIIDRMISHFCSIPLSHIKRGTLTDAERDEIKEARMQFTSLKFEIVEASGHTVQWIRNEAVRRNAQVIFVDYIGIVKSYGKSRYEMVTNAINDLHVMAQSEKITTIALSQLNRTSLQNSLPSMADLKESGGIEEASDMVLLLHNGGADGYKMILGKNKEGRVGTIEMRFDGETQTLFELSNEKSPF